MAIAASERHACRTLGQHQSTQREVPRGQADKERLTVNVIDLARQYGRYGYRVMAGVLNNAGWHVNHKRVERIWRREELKLPGKQRKRRRIWLDPFGDRCSPALSPFVPHSQLQDYSFVSVVCLRAGDQPSLAIPEQRKTPTEKVGAQTS